MKEAVFSLKGYKFPMVKLNFMDIKQGNNNLKLSIEPQGVFSKAKHSFLLTFNFIAFFEGDSPCVEILCEGEFIFKDINSIDEIPSYFYANSIAILFPYIRAFVSVVTLQTNYPPIVLPTMNLSALSNTLRDKTCVIE